MELAHFDFLHNRAYSDSCDPNNGDAYCAAYKIGYYAGWNAANALYGGAGCSSMTGFHERLSKIFLVYIVSRPHNIKFLDHQAIVLDNGPYNPKTGFRVKPISRWIDLEHSPRAGIQTSFTNLIFLTAAPNIN
jgi:hypothetical protein